jgi:hypothetical protein
MTTELQHCLSYELPICPSNVQAGPALSPGQHTSSPYNKATSSYSQCIVKSQAVHFCVIQADASGAISEGIMHSMSTDLGPRYYLGEGRAYANFFENTVHPEGIKGDTSCSYKCIRYPPTNSHPKLRFIDICYQQTLLPQKNILTLTSSIFYQVKVSAVTSCFLSSCSALTPSDPRAIFRCPSTTTAVSKTLSTTASLVRIAQ